MGTLEFAIVGALIVGALVVLVTKIKDWKRWVPILKHFFEVARISFNYWGLNRTYAKTAKLGIHFLALTEVTSKDPDKSAKRVARFVKKAYKTYYPRGDWDGQDHVAAVAAYTFILQSEELKDIITELIDGGHKNLDVRKATYILIDVLGEVVTRKDELGQQYFQHLIYGLNRCLVIVRDNGTNDKNLKKIVATLYRVYKLTKAYRHRRGLKNLTEVEFYEKTLRTLNTMRKFTAGLD